MANFVSADLIIVTLFDGEANSIISKKYAVQPFYLSNPLTLNQIKISENIIEYFPCEIVCFQYIKFVFCSCLFLFDT